ncbi:metal-dependent hydrolase [Candidatus Woesearchaeota archaeon]|nr:metal-dependent hydrolase [Candidatus Woesearchaeota archaeon]
MNFLAHLSFGVFSGLLVYKLTGNLAFAMTTFFFQVVLILDFLCKKAFRFEPLHTVLVMVAVWITTSVLFPAYHFFVLLAYSSHLFLDIFVDEEIPLLYPFRTRVSYPLRRSELVVIWCSSIGSIVIIFM